MIGIILTGHGEFAPGLAHALQMIAGPQKAFKVVAFKEEEPMEALEASISAAMTELLAETKGVVVFSDLLGGSPFKAAMVAGNDYDNVEVVCGTNLPMLIEIAILREFVETPMDVVNQSLAAGKDAIQHVQLTMNANQDQDEYEDEDGI